MPVPSRHSPSAVARYERFFELVTQNYPDVVVIDPAPLSTETFACRFRDAVRGVLLWGSGTQELYDKIMLWANDYTVATVPGTGMLMIGSQSAVRNRLKKKTTVGSVVDASLAPMDTLDSPSDKVIKAIVTLLENNFLGHATLTGVSLEKVQSHLTSTARPIECFEQNGTITLL